MTELSLISFDLTQFLQEDKHSLDVTRVVFPRVVKPQIADCGLFIKELATSFPSLHTLVFVSVAFLQLYYAAPYQDYVLFPNLMSIEGWFKYIDAIINVNASQPRLCRGVVSYDCSDVNSGVGKKIAPFALPRAAPHLKSIHFSRR